jgi:hypothetical protein
LNYEGSQQASSKIFSRVGASLLKYEAEMKISEFILIEIKNPLNVDLLGAELLRRCPLALRSPDLRRCGGGNYSAR